MREWRRLIKESQKKGKDDLREYTETQYCKEKTGVVEVVRGEGKRRKEQKGSWSGSSWKDKTKETAAADCKKGWKGEAAGGVVSDSCWLRRVEGSKKKEKEKRMMALVGEQQAKMNINL